MGRPAMVELRPFFKGSLTGEAVQAFAIKERFERFAALWRKTRGLSSSPDRLTRNPNYEQIIQLGHPVIPFVLAELKQRPDFWFRALRELTGTDPVPAMHRGDLDAMTEDWIAWAESKDVGF